MRNARYEDAYKLAGVIRTINVADLFVRQLVLEIEQPKLQHVASFGRGKGLWADLERRNMSTISCIDSRSHGGIRTLC